MDGSDCLIGNTDAVSKAAVNSVEITVRGTGNDEMQEATVDPSEVIIVEETGVEEFQATVDPSDVIIVEGTGVEEFQATVDPSDVNIVEGTGIGETGEDNSIALSYDDGVAGHQIVTAHRKWWAKLVCC